MYTCHTSHMTHYVLRFTHHALRFTFYVLRITYHASGELGMRKKERIDERLGHRQTNCWIFAGAARAALSAAPEAKRKRRRSTAADRPSEPGDQEVPHVVRAAAAVGSRSAGARQPVL